MTQNSHELALFDVKVDALEHSVFYRRLFKLVYI